MDNDRNPNFDEERSAKDAEFEGETAPRARNRTVMLTPDVTGEVRARLAQEMGSTASRPAAHEAQPSRSAGFMSVNELRGERHEAPAVAHHAATPAPAPAARKEGVVWAQESPVVGFLVSFDENPNGTVYELRVGRLIVTSEHVGGGNYLLIKESSVSPMHAIMRITPNGEIQVLDQLSEFGTRIQRFGLDSWEELSGDKASLEHGDVVKFGQRQFNVCVIARGDRA